MTEERLSYNLRYAKEKIKELENEKGVLQLDNENLRAMLKSVQEKNQLLAVKVA